MAQPWEILKVGKNPTWEEVHKAYLKMSFEYHPDKHPGEEEYYNRIMGEINSAFDYYKCFLDKKTKIEEKEHRKAYKDYTEEEKRRVWEEMQEEWKRRSQATYRESGRKMRAKIARNLEPIMDVNKVFKKDIKMCNTYDDLLELATSYATKIEEMINSMYEYTEKYHRYGMPPQHEYHTQIRDEKVNCDYPLQKVESSLIAAIGYDEENQLLYIQFHGNSVYVYYGVVNYVYDGLMKANSKGKYFREYIRNGGYKYTRLT